MAKVTLLDPISSLSGRASKKNDVYFRKMNGKIFAVQLTNPRTRDKASSKEGAYRARVGELSKEASRINNDEAQAAKYNDWASKGYSSRYRFILSELIRMR